MGPAGEWVTLLAMPAPELVSQSAIYLGAICWHNQLLFGRITLLSTHSPQWHVYCCVLTRDCDGTLTGCSVGQSDKNCQIRSKLLCVSVCPVCYLLRTSYMKWKHLVCKCRGRCYTVSEEWRSLGRSRSVMASKSTFKFGNFRMRRKFDYGGGGEDDKNLFKNLSRTAQ